MLWCQAWHGPPKKLAGGTGKADPPPLPHRPSTRLPQLDRLVVRREEEVTAAAACAAAPSHFVDLLLNLKGLEVVKLRLVRLELGEVPVLVGVGAQRRGRPLVRVA